MLHEANLYKGSRDAVFGANRKLLLFEVSIVGTQAYHCLAEEQLLNISKLSMEIHWLKFPGYRV